MATKTISLDEEAYERLRTRKREGESFSDVVKRLAGERSWQEVAGIWAGETDDLEAVDRAGTGTLSGLSRATGRRVPEMIQAEENPS